MAAAAALSTSGTEPLKQLSHRLPALARILAGYRSGFARARRTCGGSSSIDHIRLKSARSWASHSEKQGVITLFHALHVGLEDGLPLQLSFLLFTLP